jgi:hypothetical protein
MRNRVIRLAVIMGAVLTTGACADSPTQSEHQRSSGIAVPVGDEQVAPQGCVVGGLCTLPPISGGWCDPYEELDWSCDDGGGECMTSVEDPTDPEEAMTVQSCPSPGGGSGGGVTTPPPSGGDPGTICPSSDTGTCSPEEESTICPQPFIGNVQPALITVAGRNHEFQFHSSLTYPFKRLTAGRSPATYEIGMPTSSRDTWWIAERGTITVWCRGAWISRTHWLGTLTVVDSDLHMVMGPGHPDF